MSNVLRRRQFLKFSTGAVFSGAFLTSRTRAGESIGALYQRIIPTRKNLDVSWALSLAKRGAAFDAGIQTNRKSDLPNIGMTVGGIGCGTVYLSGDGRLYVWDVFHQPHEGVVAASVEIPAGLKNIDNGGKKIRERDGANYVSPPTAENRPNPFRQGFILAIDGDGQSRPLDRSAWEEVAFTGRWPLGVVEYSDPGSPLDVKLESWTPFIPLATDDSSLPVTVMEYTLENPSGKTIKGRLTGIWENPVLLHTRRKRDAKLRSRVLSEGGRSILFHEAVKDEDLSKLGDFGTAALTLLEDADNPEADDRLTARFEIPAGGKTTIRFLLTWRFSNMHVLKGAGIQQPHYTTRFKDAAAVARHVADRFGELRSATMKWVETWNDSTLPQWLLDRSILTTNTLQTTTCHIFSDRRFWAWEGIGCCPGTCAHVWHYAQGVARLFPEFERNLREVTDYGIAINSDGSIRFRAEAAGTVAIDAQTGIILRTWREHLISPNKQFLTRVWPAAKRALEWLVRFDENGRGGLDGLLDGKQHNTLDAEWYGKVHCLCSLYLAALRAGSQMALQMDDAPFAATCDEVHAMGSEKIASLFNGEFYTQDEDPAHSTAIGVGQGCYIDQVIGQWWAHQIGLGRIYEADHIRKALSSLWKYNFVPEVGGFREAFPKGRFYALSGDAGLIMCSWPKGGLRDDFKKHWQYSYFNECMTGFEWQVAAHMVQEGTAIRAADLERTAALLEQSDDAKSLTVRGLAVGRAIHDRYAPEKRNPYNEIECSDHYARANASYSLFLAACGFSYDGPAGRIGFAPKILPEDFRAPFTTAEGWGTFAQKGAPEKPWTASLRMAHGRLILNEVRLPWLKDGSIARIGDTILKASFENGAARFSKPLILTADGAELMFLVS